MGVIKKGVILSLSKGERRGISPYASLRRSSVQAKLGMTNRANRHFPAIGFINGWPSVTGGLVWWTWGGHGLTRYVIARYKPISFDRY